MRLGQFFSSNATDGSSLVLKISDLIRGADKIEGMQTDFSVQSALVNDYLLTHTLKSGNEAVTLYLSDNDLGSEVIDYVVLQTPAISISTGLKAEYSLI